ncbi:MAG: alpha/beta hydrolase [Gordonia sp. (in: high G+C Gram-positive bacteria)]|uniref:alpha/beta hydrolase n=1 Tax=Gordonia sp. (in: high G+C Gram-positive bacteria) TaxID=84139 RepID=UPI003C73947D
MVIGAILSAVTLLSSCAVGPDTGPNIVRGDTGNAANSEVPKQPGLSAPKRDLNWRSCNKQLTEKYASSLPKTAEFDGIKFDCARYDVPVDANNQGGTTIRVGAVRARTQETPADAVPIVLTSGDDMPSSRTLLSLASGAGIKLLDRNPVVAIDHRGMGTSGLIDCLTNTQRAAYDVNAASPTADMTTRAQKLSEVARSAADQCNDTLSPDQLAYSAAAAGEDLEQLRERWDVDRLAVLAVGTGSSVALALAGKHPDSIGRLILDSPVGFNVSAKDATASRARGLQATLAAFLQRCAALGCSLGANGPAVLGRLMSSGATPSNGALADTEVLAAIMTALAVGDTSEAGLKSLSTALTDADRGETAALKALADASRPIRLADGQVVARCNDLRGHPGTAEIPALAKDWSAQSPLTSNTTALDLVRCDGWGVADTPSEPTSFAVNPLLLIGQNDPINGADAAHNLAPLFLATGTNQTTVTWDGLGYSVTAGSGCAVALIDEYLGTSPLAAPMQRACPT